MTSGLPHRSLGYDTFLPVGRIHGFAFCKFAKPANEHHLQVALTEQGSFPAVYRDITNATET